MVLVRLTAAVHGTMSSGLLSETVFFHYRCHMRSLAAEQTVHSQLVNELQHIWYFLRVYVIVCSLGAASKGSYLLDVLFYSPF